MFTCINCNIKFGNADIQRDHYKSDWHRYNLKRKIADLPPITAQDFQQRVLQQKTIEETATQGLSLHCNPCQKNFNSQNSYENHLNGKKHKENLSKFIGKGGEEKSVINAELKQTIKNSKVQLSSDEDFEIVDSDEWEDDEGINVNTCIFCKHISNDMVENLRHMSITHSFFVPDAEYCVDIAGLIAHLIAKVTKDYICLWCNEKGKTFYSLDSVRKHMNDKGHCKMLHEGVALAEYADYYDYSSSYPDYNEEMDLDEQIEDQQILDGEDYQLVLPSGIVIGHRSLMRYYKQRLNPERAIVPTKSNRHLHKVLAEYRSLGWTATQQELAKRKARDVHTLKRQQNKWNMQLGVKSNKLQKHFREQVNF